MGYVDEDGFLFLTGRTAECIISGGVEHPPAGGRATSSSAIRPCARPAPAARPIPRRGEEVKAVIALYPGYQPTPELAKELLDFIRPSLASSKMPRSVDFDRTTSPARKRGKVQRR